MAKSPGTGIQWRFLTLFAAIYCAFYLGYSVVPDEVLRERVYYYGIVCPARAVIHWVAPADLVVGQHNYLRSAGAQLNIVRGCDGAGVIFLLAAAILAFRARWRATLGGLVGAVALIYTLNLTRIVVLYFVNVHLPAWFTPVHVYLIPTFMILVGTVYFALWAAQNDAYCEPRPQG
jgi:exosortase family protein XrtM